MAKFGKTFHLVSLGCAKNLVDSDSMAQMLDGSGYTAVEDPGQAGLLIVNTCGFIGPAKDESLETLADLAQNKQEGQRLIAAGCLTQRYGAEVVRRVPGIDALLGTRRWMDIMDVTSQLRDAGGTNQTLYHLPDTPTVGGEVAHVKRVSMQGTSAYLKIADGCRRPCAFCAIPLIKGTAVSRPEDSILQEARLLAGAGVRELVLIAQDTTDYGHDLGVKDGLAQLLEKLAHQVPQIDWIRVLYAYPGYVTERLIEVMAGYKQILPYLDMPLQHAHLDTLRRMRRPANMDWVYRTLDSMRANMPGLALRTTFIVGYPGETDAEFQSLLDFVSEVRFDRVGAFQFSYEAGTESEALGDPVPQEVKQERFERLMELQQGISLEINQSFVGQRLDVLVEGCADGLSVGRSYRDAPEIDGMVVVEGELPLGDIVPVMVNGAMVYDLSGMPLGRATGMGMPLDQV